MTVALLDWPMKDPADNLDYSMDWQQELSQHSPADVIQSFVWTIPAGLTGGVQTTSGSVTTAWIAGGAAEQEYVVSCRITTVGGRILERSVKLFVAEL